MHVHTMISVWPLYTPPSANFDEMPKHGYFVTGGRTQGPSYYPGSRLFDAFNPDGRKMFWQQMKIATFSTRVSRPGGLTPQSRSISMARNRARCSKARTPRWAAARCTPTATLSSKRKAVYEGQRATTDKQRVFILTRSAFLGPAAPCRDFVVRRHRADV